jgi:hypothetical protein
VLLLDEIEKAHPDIFNVLLQVMDHGTLTDNNGRKADFRNVIIIMTTNAGAETMNKATIGFTNPRQAGDEMGDIKRLFTPEFRNRLDAIVSFKALDEQIILRVVDKFLLQLETQLAEKKVEVTFTDTLRKHLAKKGFDPLMGARPMQRLIQDTIRRALADELLFGRLTEGGRLTVDMGYNTIRFDDEVTRFLFWRNLIDPYAREWQNGCGRWDILDLVRATWALRPEGITWPQRPDGGGPSFKLEHLTAANGLSHESAHDALSDVRATLALARLIREKQPKLFDFCFALHRKDRVAQELGLPCAPAHAKPFLHVSGMFGVERGCLAVMWPLASHPSNKNELIAWDLAHDPAELASLDVATLRQRLFTRSADLPEGVARLPVKTVHLNKSPVVIGNLKVLTPALQARWGLDLDQACATPPPPATCPT